MLKLTIIERKSKELRVYGSSALAADWFSSKLFNYTKLQSTHQELPINYTIYSNALNIINYTIVGKLKNFWLNFLALLSCTTLPHQILNNSTTHKTPPDTLGAQRTAFTNILIKEFRSEHKRQRKHQPIMPTLQEPGALWRVGIRPYKPEW